MYKKVDKRNILEFSTEQKAQLQAIADKIKIMVEPITSNNTFDIFYESYVKNVKPIIEAVEKQLSTLDLSIFKVIYESLTEIDIDEKERIIANCFAIKCAQYGLVSSFTNNFLTYNDINEEYVSDLCEKYSSGVEFDRLVSKLSTLKYNNTQLTSEAIECYKRGLYLGCSSILFEMIIREVTMSQEVKKDKKGKNIRRPFFNYNKYNKYCEMIDENYKTADYLTKKNFLYLYYYYFKCGNDFDFKNTEDYPILNRNFLAHGMIFKNVERNDCIKLFMFINALNTQLDTVLSCIVDD